MITLESFISITSHRCSLINLDDIIRKQREIEVFNDKARKHSVGETVGWEQSLHKLLQDIGVHADLDQHFSQFVTPSPCLCIAVTFADKVSKYSNYVVGIDISRYACLNAKKHSGKKCDFVVCDAENLPFQKEVFSTVIILAVLHHLPNVANALAQFNRVLRCKGTFILNEPGILNPFMMIGRHLFFKGLVTSDETPFVPSWLEQQVSRAFTIQKINHRYFMSQLMPLFLQILPDKSLRQHSLKASYMVDCQLLRLGLNQLCWSFNIVGKKQ